MDYLKKASKWIFSQKEKADLERIKSANGRMGYENKNGVNWVDSMYFCVRRNGKKISEGFWKDSAEMKETPSGQFLIKERKKMIFLQWEEGYGFGFGDKDRTESIVLYFRKGSGAMLIWSDASSKSLNVMYEVNTDNPDSMDSLIGFMREEKDVEGIWPNEKLEGGI